MIRYILLFLGAWLLYKLIFDLIVPVYKGTKVMRAKIKEMQDQMNQQTSQDSNTQFTEGPKTKSQSTDGDYIEFEEVK
jgi:hypothetical protein